MDKDMAKVLFSQEELQTRIRELGAQLSEDYRGKTPTMVCILKGAIMFYTDLVRSMDIPLTMDFMAVSSYGNSTKSSGEVEIRKDLSTSIEGKHVVIVEDIDLHIKDLNNALETGEKFDSPLPLTEMVQSAFRELSGNGDGSLDHSALLKYYSARTGVKLKEEE